MKNFDQFVGIDWSGAKAPIKTKSIAVATCPQGQLAPTLHEKIRSRTAVAEWMESLIKEDKRTLIGIDCNFGYAAQVVKKQLGIKANAYDLWAEVERVNEGELNFFAGQFWSHKKYASDFWTQGKMPDEFTMPKRVTEVICTENGYGRPESPFKLIGAKQVGKGGLAGMLLAHYLKKNFGKKIAIWPFDTHYNEANVVMTEIYPRQFLMRVGHGTTKVRDQETLNSILPFFGSQKIREEQNITDHDTDALVSAAGLRYLCGMKANVPPQIAKPAKMTPNARLCEGWIFGVGDRS
jgi:hypothetical protein